MEVAIFGAGPCGLTAAWELAKNGITPIVIEKENTVGGLCKTTRRDGYQFDLGGHRFISKDRDLVRDIRRLMGDALLTRTRKSVIRFCDGEYDYPINILNVIERSSPWRTLKFAAGYSAALAGLPLSRAPENSFERWVDTSFGKPLSNFFFKPYTEKLWGIPASSLSDDWAAQRISRLNTGRVLLEALGLSKAEPRSHALKYLYPTRGIGAIFETMVEEIERLGGKVLTGFQPIRFGTNGHRIDKVLVVNDNGDRETIEADRYLSTIPLDALMGLLGYGNTLSLPFRSLRFLNIQLNRERLSPNTWMYVPESDLMMTRIQEPKHRSPFSVPKGKTSVMLEIPCSRGDVLWDMGDEALLRRAIKDLRKLGFDIEGEITGCFSTRAEHAYPCYKIGYLKTVEAIRHTIDRYENLTTLGREGLFRYIFMDTAMIMGRTWAQSILGQRGGDSIDELDSQPILLETRSVAC